MTNEQRNKLRRFSKVTNLITSKVSERELDEFAEGKNNVVASYYDKLGFKELDKVRASMNLGQVDGLYRGN